jgi:microcystin-dependent protein
MALRNGFRIPNADTFAPDFQTAQPDQGDFLILGNSQYGVITGCSISISGSTVAVGGGPNLLVVEGQLYTLSPGLNLSVSPPAATARFDLIVYDTSLASPFAVVAGTPAANPVFPDVTSTMTVLAAVFIPASGGSGISRVIDKRNFLQTEVIAVDTPMILKNLDSGGTHIKVSINGNGKISWGDGSSVVDTTLERSGVGIIRTPGEFSADVVTASSSATVAGKDVITTETIEWGNGAGRPAASTKDIGDVYVDNTTGDISVVKLDTEAAKQWTSLQPNLPSGSVIQSLVAPDKMAGWLPLVGGIYATSEAGNLPSLFPEWVSGSNITLPDMRGRIPAGGGDITGGSIGTTNGTVLDGTGRSSVTLTEANLPPHSHRTGTATQAAGAHAHTGTTAGGGAHTHTADGHTGGTGDAGAHGHSASDSGHWHYWEGGFPIVATFPGAYHDSCMDIPFADASHTYRTLPEPHSMFGTANITVTGAPNHFHSIGTSSTHTHTIDTMSTAAAHTHTLPEHRTIGSGTSFTVQPPTLSLYFYIKM